MTINELRYLLTIVEEGSINKAAEKLYISQSALSKCVKRMEAEYGICIFERKQGSKLSLSKEGKLLLRFAQKVNEANSEFWVQLNVLKMVKNDTIVLGMPYQRTYVKTNPMFHWFYAHDQKFQLQVVSDSTDRLLQKLQDNMVDILYISTEAKNPQFYYKLIKRNHLAIYLAKGSPLIKKAKYIDKLECPVLSLKDIKDDILAVNHEGSASRKNLEEALRHNGYDTHLQEIDNIYARFNFADQGNGHCILTGDAGWFHIDLSRLCYLVPEEDVQFNDYLVCRKGYEGNDEFKLVYQCVMDIL